MKRKVGIGIALGVGGVLALIFLVEGNSQGSREPLITHVRKGDFRVPVHTTGELQAKRSVEIRGPEAMQNRTLRIREVKILDMVEEGTVVDSGDYVARLDKTEALSELKDIEDDLAKRKSDYIKTKLDTAMQLKKLRNQLIDLEYSLEEHKIKVKQSQYEPPATQRQAGIELERARRELRQARDNYQLEIEQAKAEMNEVSINLAKQQRRKRKMEEVLKEFTIRAPRDGMVIYKKDWNGQKRTTGSTISPWDLTVATLPDLTSLISKTYVNEIDISKVETGQPVKIGVDAFPGEQYPGKVTDVANIGQELRSTGAKVFEVLITLNETDSILRPSMTTSNEIITGSYRDVMYLPLEAVHSKDSIHYVYTTNPGKKQVIVGASNENHVIIRKGLRENQQVYLSVPEDAQEMEIIPVKESPV
ncbi:MAG: efflux RND transporter periplasmic adaptor subunit [Bacteroidales bacterium]|nr:efflux RND transporter periplasmic adaptor subunit [Bacteroidales bacterium]